MPKDGERMELSRRLTTLQSTPRQRFFRRLGRRRLCSRAFRASLGNAGQPMRSAISAGLLSSSTPRREIGTSSETILQSFSSAIRYASLTSITLSSATPAPVFGARRITGTSGLFFQRHSIRSQRHVRPRHSKVLPAYAWLRKSHLLDDQCREQAHVGEVPLPLTARYRKSRG